MPKRPLCFVVMPFLPELNYFYLYLQRHISEKHGLRVERGDHRILTKALMDKVRDRIAEADLILGDVSFANPNVFYEIGLAHALGKPVVFLTQDKPEAAPVDIRQFEFIHYDLHQHEQFLIKIDNAIANVFVSKYRGLYDDAIHILGEFNHATASSYAPATLEDFQARVMRGEQARDMPSREERAIFAEFLLPKILNEVTDLLVMQKVTQWVATLLPEGTQAQPGS
jgi:hypothetical protein